MALSRLQGRTWLLRIAGRSAARARRIRRCPATGERLQGQAFWTRWPRPGLLFCLGLQRPRCDTGRNDGQEEEVGKAGGPPFELILIPARRRVVHPFG